MTPISWVPFKAVILIHDRQIARHGRASGLRDMGVLEMACARPRNLEADETPDHPASYGFGIAKAHAFVDGNKHTAFVSAITFLRLNGLFIRPDPAEGVAMMEGLAADSVSAAALAAWFRAGTGD